MPSPARTSPPLRRAADAADRADAPDVEPSPAPEEAEPAADRAASGSGPGDRERTGATAPRRPWWRRRLVEDTALIAVAIVVAILVRSYVAQAYYIPSASMEPQLRIDDRVVVSRLSYDLHSVHRGDIIVFKAPPGVEPEPSQPSDPILRVVRDVGVALGLAQDQSVLIKRVIGLPGETVEGKNGHVYINGVLLIEPYLPEGTFTSSFGPETVPKGDVWVMGDNRGDSTDSRSFGPIPEHTIVGRAIWKVWPPWRTSFL